MTITKKMIVITTTKIIIIIVQCNILNSKSSLR